MLSPLALVLSLAPTLEAQAPNTEMRQVLIDSASGLRIEEWQVDERTFDLGGGRPWRVRKSVLHGGRQEGVDLVEIDGGELSFKVVPTRGMNLWDARCGGLRLGWDSPVSEVVHPSLVNLDARGGLGWLEGFAEWINRCGLASNGSPGLDQVRSNTGAIVPVQLTLHGKVSYIPARHVEVAIERAPEPRIAVRGVVDETMMFGTALRLETEISHRPGSKSLTIRDVVRNVGSSPQEMQLLYHCNFGRPLLEDGARFFAPVRRVTPRDARAAEGGMAGWDVFSGPTAGFVEQVHFLRLAGDDQGRTEVLLQNRAADKGVTLEFSLGELPYLTLWKNTAAEGDGYVTGIEPGTNYPNLRSIERQAGRVPKLEGGATYRAEVTIRVLTDSAAVAEARGRIAALQGTVRPQIDTQPEAK